MDASFRHSVRGQGIDMNDTFRRVGPVAFLAFSLMACSRESAPDSSSRAGRVSPPKEVVAAGMESAVPELMKKAGIPGLSIAVLKEGRLAWSAAYGIKSALTKEPVDENTIFEAASLTKPFFAYYALKLVDEGTLDLDRPLVGCLPPEVLEKTYLKHPLDREGFRRDWFERITARMVLSHSSGLPHGGPRMPVPILFEPGTKYRYSSDGILYLQRVVEYLKGKPLEILMKEAVIDPLGMTSSSLVWEPRYESTAAVGHDFFGETDGKFRKRKTAHAAATLYTTARDYARFVAAILTGEGLRPDTARMMLEPQIPVAPEIAWGLGFGLETTPAGRAFWQWGDYGIFRNYVVGYRDSGAAFVYLTDSFNGLSIARDISRLVFGIDAEPAVAYLDYVQHDAPAMGFVRAVAENDAAEASALFRKLRAADPGEFDEKAVNWAGYVLLGARKIPLAIAVFRLNVETYPDSANVYDSLSDAYRAAGDKEQTALYCRKTLEAIPRDKTADRETLESLRQSALEKLKAAEKKLGPGESR